MQQDNINICDEYIDEKITPLRPLFAKSALGDFSGILQIPEGKGAVTELYIGIQVMLQVMKDQLAQLRGFNQSLEQKVQDRTEELEEAYRQRQENEQNMKSLQEKFSFIAAHELRSPVTDINIGLSALLESGAVKEPQHITLLKRIQAKNSMLVQLLNDLLDVAGLRGEEKEYKLTKVPLDMLFREVAEEVSSTVKQLGIQITFPTPGNLLSVLAHPRSLKEVLLNLITNAIRYNKKNGSVMVEIESNKAEVIIHVKDSGIGIGRNNIDKLFTQFYRIKEEETKEIDGTGLGLFISKELMRRMHGNIWVESKKGEGSTFSFSLPIYTAP